MPPKIFYNEMCAQSRAVALLLGAADLQADLHQVSLYGKEQDADLLQVSGKVRGIGKWGKSRK